MKNNPIHYDAIKQHPEFGAIWPHCLGGPILSQMTVKTLIFNSQ